MTGRATKALPRQSNSVKEDGMDAELMDRLELAARVLASARRVEDAAVEYAMACEACAQDAGEALAWCRGEDAAGLAEVSQTLGERLADARETARNLHRAAWCVADGVVAEAMDAMSPEDGERMADAVAAAMTPAEFKTLDVATQEAVRERRGRLGLPLECLPDRLGHVSGIPLDAVRVWLGRGVSRTAPEARKAGEGIDALPDDSESSSARPEAGKGMSGGEAVYG